MSGAPAPRERFLLRTALSLAGPLLWAAHFGAAYGLGHVGCAIGLEGQPIRYTVLVATLAALVLTSIVFAVSWRVQHRGFFRPVTLWLLALSAFGILATGLAALFLPGCAPLR